MKKLYIKSLKELLDLQIETSNDLEVWKGKAITIVTRIYGEKSNQVVQIAQIQYLSYGGVSIPGAGYTSFGNNLDNCRVRAYGLIRAYVDEIEKFGPPTDKTKSTKWKFWNSNLGLWILGLIFLSVIPFAYNFFADQYKESEKKLKRIELVDSEMRGRVQQLISKIDRIQDSTNLNGNIRDIYEIKDIWFAFKGAPSQTGMNTYKFYSLNKEFDDYTTISILNELNRVLDDSQQKRQISEVIELIQTDGIVSAKNKYDSVDVVVLRKNIQEKILLDRWR